MSDVFDVAGSTAVGDDAAQRPNSVDQSRAHGHGYRDT